MLFDYLWAVRRGFFLFPISEFRECLWLFTICSFAKFHLYAKCNHVCFLNTVQCSNWCMWCCKATTVHLSIHFQSLIRSVCKCTPLHPLYWEIGNKLNQCWWHICRQLLALIDNGHNIWSQTCTVCHTNTALRSGHSSIQLYSWWISHTQAKVRVGRSLTPGIYIYMYVCVCSSPVLSSPLEDIILKC